MRHRAAIVTLGLVAALAVAPATSPATKGGKGPKGSCPDQQLQPTKDDLGRIRQGLLCLINAQRAQHNLKPLRFNRALDRAAIAHSRDMLRRHYFSHVDPDGRDPFARIAAAGFGGRWKGENMSAGVGPTGTPYYMWAHWQDPTHIANILGAHFQWIGIGVAYGFPVGHYDHADTITADFGGR
jgi:uncharacterized protein YkwD